MLPSLVSRTQLATTQTKNKHYPNITSITIALLNAGSTQPS